MLLYEKGAQPKPRAEKRITPIAATQTFTTLADSKVGEYVFTENGKNIFPLKLQFIRFTSQVYFNTRHSACKEKESRHGPRPSDCGAKPAFRLPAEPILERISQGKSTSGPACRAVLKVPTHIYFESSRALSLLLLCCLKLSNWCP